MFPLDHTCPLWIFWTNIYIWMNLNIIICPHNKSKYLNLKLGCFCWHAVSKVNHFLSQADDVVIIHQTGRTSWWGVTRPVSSLGCYEWIIDMTKVVDPSSRFITSCPHLWSTHSHHLIRKWLQHLLWERKWFTFKTLGKNGSFSDIGLAQMNICKTLYSEEPLPRYVLALVCPL